MGFLNNLFDSSNKRIKISNREDTVSFMVNDMERKWKMHVEQNVPSSDKNVVTMTYAVQVIKFRAALPDMEEAKKVQNRSMAYGLVPLIKNGNLRAELSEFLEIYIYYYKDNTVSFLSSIVNEDNDEIIANYATDLEHAIEKYKDFIEEIHKKTFLKKY